MTTLMASGATWPMMVCAMDEFVPMRWAMSPVMRCEKNSIGMWSTFQKKDALEVAAILP